MKTLSELKEIIFGLLDEYKKIHLHSSILRNQNSLNYNRLIKRFTPPNIQEFVRELNVLSHRDKGKALEILEHADLLTYNNFVILARYKSQANHSIYTATCLWLAKDIKKLHLEDSSKQIPKKIDDILETVLKIIPVGSNMSSGSWEKFFSFIKKLGDERLYNRSDYLQILAAALEIRANNPKEYTFLDIALNCCISQNADTNQFLNILQALTPRHFFYMPFREYFGDNYYQDNIRVTDEQEPAMFKVLLKHVDFIKREIDTMKDVPDRYRAPYLFLFKDEEKQDVNERLRASVLLQPEPSIHCLSKFQPTLFSMSASDKPEKSNYGDKTKDVGFKFR